METILVLLHTEADGSLAKTGLETLNAARHLQNTLPSSSLVIGLVGSVVQPAANQIAQCGAANFLAVTGPEFHNALYATDAIALETIAREAQPTLILAPATSRSNRVFPGVAHRLGGCADTHVTAFGFANGTLNLTRWFYRQRIEAQFSRTQRPWCILIEPGTHAPWSGQPGSVEVQILPALLPDSARRTAVVGFHEPAPDQQTIRPEADFLFVAGAGWTKKQADGQPHLKQAEKLILDFLDLTRASLGSSKSLVDLSGEGQAVLSFLTHLNQIGQTGATPRHSKGLATCCHGEEPHTVGWRFIRERRAINLDPNCGWARGKADVLYVADAFAVVAKINALLSDKSSV